MYTRVHKAHTIILIIILLTRYCKCALFIYVSLKSVQPLRSETPEHQFN